MKNKMSKIITFVLVVIIVFVVGTLAYYTFNYFKNKKINEKALNEIDEFDKNIPTLTLAEYEELVKKENIDENQESSYVGSDSDTLFPLKIGRAHV